MTSKNFHCPLQAGSDARERFSFRSRPIDSPIAQAFSQLRLHTEELALELAVRLRVLGKSLAAACPGAGRKAERTACSLAYTNLRGQLDGFLGELGDCDFAGQHSFAVIRHYLQEILPFELSGCVGDPCRIEMVEAAISLLSENVYENDAVVGDPLPSFSR